MATPADSAPDFLSSREEPPINPEKRAYVEQACCARMVGDPEVTPFWELLPVMRASPTSMSNAASSPGNPVRQPQLVLLRC